MTTEAAIRRMYKKEMMKSTYALEEILYILGIDRNSDAIDVTEYVTNYLHRIRYDQRSNNKAI